MIYKEFQGLKLSALGMGTMRLPILDGNSEHIDAAQTEKMVAHAMANGINYYDTAWGYHEGHSEVVMGQALKAYPRDSFYLADKFPGYDLANMPYVEKIFEEQLQRCQVDYFDFYLVHNVCEENINQYLDPQYRIHSYLTEQKRNGRIKHLGFSAHGDIDVLRRFLEVYGDDMEFCQLQINWLDWEFQSAREKCQLMAERNIPIWVMEPLRGGKLCKLTEEDMAKLDALRPGLTPVQWAFRFLQTLPEVKVILSGMSDYEQMIQNVATFQTEEPLTPTEFDALLALGREMTGRVSVPCTACRYCTAHCPQGLDIPLLLEYYNERVFTGGGFLAPMKVGALPEDKRPSACVGCRSCEQVCPQTIKVSEVLADFCRKLAE